MKIRKAFQGTIPENKVLDTYSTSQTDTYSCSYINGIIESDSNSNGNYIKYADGTLINMKTISGSIASSQWANGIGYVDIQNGDWAVNFTTLLNCQVTNTTNQFWATIHNPTTTSAGATRLVRPYDTTQASNYKINIFAIGRWK